MVNRRDFLQTFAMGTLLATGGPGNCGEAAGSDPQG